MEERAKEMRRAYKRNWSRRNPDKVRAAQERYWERKAAEESAQDTEPTDENKTVVWEDANIGI